MFPVQVEQKFIRNEENTITWLFVFKLRFKIARRRARNGSKQRLESYSGEAIKNKTLLPRSEERQKRKIRKKRENRKEKKRERRGNAAGRRVTAKTEIG